MSDLGSVIFQSREDKEACVPNKEVQENGAVRPAYRRVRVQENAARTMNCRTSEITAASGRRALYSYQIAHMHHFA